MKRRIKHLSIRDGSLIPLGNNFAYVLGDHPNKVDDVDIGPNNKNGLSVNHGELMQFGGNSVRVFSAEPILNGISPSKLVQAGMDPNAVFAAQERYKDIHHLKDDGSHARFGKLKNILKTFNNATIGAAVAENPAVMTAAGFEQDNNRNWIQNPDSEGAKQLRDNLAVISTFSPTHPFTAGIDAAFYGLGALAPIVKNFRFKINPKSYLGYRIVNKEAIKDAVKSGIIRSKSGGVPYYKKGQLFNPHLKKGDYVIESFDTFDKVAPHKDYSAYNFKVASVGDEAIPVIRKGAFDIGKLPTTKNSVYYKKLPIGFIKRTFNGSANADKLINSFGININKTNFAQAIQNELKRGKWGNLAFYRNLSGLPNVSANGKIYLSPDKNALLNVTSDLPFRLHSNYSVAPGTEYLRINPEAFKGRIPLSIEPMDTFFINDFTVDPKYIELITGNKDLIPQAEQLGIKVHSPVELQNIFSKDKGALYRDAVDNYITKTFGRPTIRDYMQLEEIVGSESGVLPISERVKAKSIFEHPFTFKEANSLKDNIAYTYPNGRDVNVMFLNKEQLIPDTGNVFYDATPPVESGLMRYFGSHSHPEKYDGIMSRLYEIQNTSPYKYYDLELGKPKIIGNRSIKKLGGIYIKPSKRGTFTAAAKKHGMSVQGFASKVLANKNNYSSAMVKKANFARNASRWHHKLGGETEINSIYGTLPLKGNPLYDITGETKYADYTNEPEFDFSGIETTNKRPYNAANVKTAYDYFKARGANDYQIAALLANAIEESGVEPYALDKTNTYYGISQWDNSRYSVSRKSKKDKNYSAEVELKDLNDQLMYYYNSVMNGNTKVDWNHGGKGSGYNTAADARQSFRDATTVDDAIRALVLGYVRPTGGIDSYKNRAKVAEQIYKLISKQ